MMLSQGFIYLAALFNTAVKAVINAINDCFLMLLTNATAMDYVLFYINLLITFSNNLPIVYFYISVKI